MEHEYISLAEVISKWLNSADAIDLRTIQKFYHMTAQEKQRDVIYTKLFNYFMFALQEKLENPHGQ